MLPLVLLVPLALVSLVPWPSASGVGPLPVPVVPPGWAPDAVTSRRLTTQELLDCLDPAVREGGYCDEHPQKQFVLGYLIVLVFLFVFCIVTTVIPSSFACLYKMKVTDQRPPLQDGLAPCAGTNDFATSPFGCCEDKSTCVHALCCPVCRAADTYKGAGIEEYWGIVLYWILAVWVGGSAGDIVLTIVVTTAAGPSDPGFVTPYPFLWVNVIVSMLIQGLFLQKYRRKLRTKLGGREEEGPNIFMDVLLFGCCTCCVIAQEARELDSATGVKVECCCQIKTGQPLQDAQPLVGQPVQGSVA